MSEKFDTINHGAEKQDMRKPSLEEVAELEAPIKKIIEKIRSRIEGGEY